MHAWWNLTASPRGSQTPLWFSVVTTLTRSPASRTALPSAKRRSMTEELPDDAGGVFNVARLDLLQGHRWDVRSGRERTSPSGGCS